MEHSLQDLRREYVAQPFNDDNLTSNPIDLFEKWLNAAIKAQILEPNGMTLSTVSIEGRATGRIVLLKDFDFKGFIFFSNYESRKAIQLAAHPHAALTFWWPEIYREICIEGSVAKLNRNESDAYFKIRPRGSQIACIASPQSLPIASRAFLENRYAEIEKKYTNQEIDCPLEWGGYRLTPERIEFWQGRENRLHDRFLYTKDNDQWHITRLAP